MKKNKMMRLAAVLLVCVLLSTSVIGGTFAKYTTTATASDNARVAKWGVTVTNTQGSMFVKEYESDSKSADPAYTANTVIAAADVVAPGTTKENLTDLVVNGTPEVAVRVTYDATLTLENWTVDSGEYCPIVFTVEGTEYKIDGTSITDVATLKSKVEAAIEACSKDYAANVKIENGTDAPTVSWSWPYSTSTDNDKKDTSLGDAATPATIKLEVKVTATQID